MSFALFFLGEYSAMFFMSSLSAILFMGGWFAIPGIVILFIEPFIFGFKATFFIFIFVWARAALPRYRYDQLMRLGWKIFLPLGLALLLFYSTTLLILNACLEY
jgi:NADH-quinone oxidoreductase subunit H